VVVIDTEAGSAVSPGDRAYAVGADPIVASVGEGRGNPLLFGRQYFPELRRLSGDTGAKPIITEASETVFVATDDPGVRRNVYSPSDL
jgi:molybdenum cofactor cytidylyltransferase